MTIAQLLTRCLLAGTHNAFDKSEFSSIQCLTLLGVSNKGFAHMLLRTYCLNSILELDIQNHHAYES
jgi:hypothetical protein